MSVKIIDNETEFQDCINKASKQADNMGSITAAKMIKAQRLFGHAISMLNSNVSANIKKFIDLMYEAFTTDFLVCIMELRTQFLTIDILNNLIKINEISDLDCKARICLLFLCGNNIELISQSLLKYPNTIMLLQLRATYYSFVNEWDKSLEDIEQALKSNPLCYETLYQKSVVIWQKDDWKNSIESLKKFLSLAPKDHRKIPQSYYMMGLAKMRWMDEMGKCFYADVKELFNKGLECEKDQLPCFIPYKSDKKDFLIKVLNSPSFSGRMEKKTSSLPDRHAMKIESITKDNRRISLILQHRELYKKINEIKQKNKPDMMEFTTKTLIKKNSVKSIKDFKPVFLRDIDLTKDNVLEKCVLSLKSIEIAIIDVSTTLVAVDDHGFVERVEIYNSKDDYDMLFEIGCNFSIKNPCIGRALDGK